MSATITQLWRTPELCNYLGISPRHAHNLRREGILDAYAEEGSASGRGGVQWWWSVQSARRLKQKIERDGRRLTVKEAAQKAGVVVAAIMNWINDGLLVGNKRMKLKARESFHKPRGERISRVLTIDPVEFKRFIAQTRGLELQRDEAILNELLQTVDDTKKPIGTDEVGKPVYPLKYPHLREGTYKWWCNKGCRWIKGNKPPKHRRARSCANGQEVYIISISQAEELNKKVGEADGVYEIDLANLPEEVKQELRDRGIERTGIETYVTESAAVKRNDFSEVAETDDPVKLRNVVHGLRDRGVAHAIHWDCHVPRSRRERVWIMREKDVQDWIERQALILKLRRGEQPPSTTEIRKKRSRDKHLKWQKWQREGLSLGQILQRHRDETGEEVSRQAIRQGIAKL